MRGGGTALPDVLGAPPAREQIRGGEIQILPLLLFLRRAPFHGCVTESRSPFALLPSCSKCCFPGERLEICTVKSAQPKHLQGSQPSLGPACARPARVWPLTHDPGSSPPQGSTGRDLLGFFSTAERGRANCYQEKAFNKGDGTTPSHHIWSKGEGEGEKGQLKKEF